MTKTILFSGQSNAVGRGDGGVFPASGAVTVWNNQNDRDDLGNLGTVWRTADLSAQPFVNGKNNMGYHACRYLADLLGEDVRMILVAQGDTSIVQWAKGAPMYERINAVLATAGVTSIDAFLWHQGEGANLAPSGYAAAFGQLLSDLEGDGIITACTPVVVGEVAAKYTAINPVLLSLEGGRVKCARLMTLTTIDDIHFGGAQLVQAGWQYAKCLHDLFSTPWSYSMGEYVSARGYAAVSLPNNASRKVPVQAVNGDTSWINVDGGFVAPAPGVYEFSASVYTGETKTWARLLDASGTAIASVAYGSDSTNPVVSGSACLELAQGDVVFLGAQQGSGYTASLSAGNAVSYCKMTVKRLEAYS